MALSIHRDYTHSTLLSETSLCQYGGEDIPANAPSLTQRVLSAFTSAIDFVAPINPVTASRQILTLIPESAELALGGYFHKTEVNRKGVSYNQDVVRLAENICERLAVVTDRNLPYQVKVADTGVLNACCFPGGFMIMNRGLIEGIMNAKSDYGLGDIPLEDKVAAIMAHEMVHGAARHGMRGVEFSLFVTGFLFVIAKVAQYALQAFADNEPNPSKRGLAEGASSAIDAIYEHLGDLIATFWQASFSRENEDESDRHGMVYLQRAGYDPKAMIWAMRYLSEAEVNLPIPWLQHAADWFRTHDHASNRAEKCEQTLDDLAAGLIATSPTSAYRNPAANLLAAEASA